MELLKEVVTDTCLDCFKMLPFLFAAFLVIEALEHSSADWTKNMLKRVGRAGPAVGALAGLIPQCGFSVMASNLYAGGVISLGTLLAAYLATSDEAILIMLSGPGQARQIGGLLLVKAFVAVTVGYMADLLLAKRVSTEKREGELCRDCGCQEEHAGILRPAGWHTLHIFLYLLVFTGMLNLAVELLGTERISRFMLGNTIWQPVAAAVVGLIPNCAASVILTQLYLNKVLSFASVVSGLCAGSGVGLAVLFRVNRHPKENLKIAGLLFAAAVVAGIVLELFQGMYAEKIVAYYA